MQRGRRLHRGRPADTTSSVSSAPFAEGWNGTKWFVQKTPELQGAVTGTLAGVSCLSAGACTAVGYTSNSSEFTATVAEVWSGTKWAVQKTPAP
jgi:branched-subunit amino acid permease